MKYSFVAMRQRRANALGFVRTTPLRGSRDRTDVCSKSYEDGWRVALANKLSRVPLAIAAALGCTRVTQMRVVRPDHNLNCGKPTLQMRGQRTKRFSHVTVAQIPGVGTVLKHPAIVFFRILHKPCILLRCEKIIFSNLSVPVHVLVCLPAEICKLLHHFFLAGLRQIECSGVTIGLLIFAEMVEIGTAVEGAPGCFRIYLGHVPDDLFTRSIHAIQIQPIEPT